MSAIAVAVLRGGAGAGAGVENTGVVGVNVAGSDKSADGELNSRAAAEVVELSKYELASVPRVLELGSRS
jgi:hypothetical protein